MLYDVYLLLVAGTDAACLQAVKLACSFSMTPGINAQLMVVGAACELQA